MAKAIMVQGTASFVGKSMLVTALCRLFYQEGRRVAPFKAQNMALNAFVTEEGGEMGYAQAVQAEACEISPTVHMNPVLLKPDAGKGVQVVVRGKVRGNMHISEFHAFREEIYKVICDSYERLAKQYDVIVIEGAGSPAEINLRETDLANMRVAEMAGAPVLLVADIDRGGAFASLVGTLELLTADERDRVKGFILNKFRGDIQLLQKGLEELEQRTGKPFLGVIPYHESLYLPDEDSVAVEERIRKKKTSDRIPSVGVRVGVVYVPHISNSTDFEALQREPHVLLEYIKAGKALSEYDLILLPGSKNTVDDLIYLWESGLAKAIQDYAEGGGEVAGICGGFQMLGLLVRDPYFVETRKEEIRGLGLLNIETILERTKVTTQVKVEPDPDSGWLSGLMLSGYEIHTGITQCQDGTTPLFRVVEEGGRRFQRREGAISQNRRVWGTYLHGLFDNDSFRHWFLNQKREKKGIPESTEQISFSRRRLADYDALASLVKHHLDLSYISKLL